MRKPGGLATIFSPTDSTANLTGRGIVEIKEGVFESDITRLVDDAGKTAFDELFNAIGQRAGERIFHANKGFV